MSATRQYHEGCNYMHLQYISSKLTGFFWILPEINCNRTHIKWSLPLFKFLPLSCWCKIDSLRLRRLQFQEKIISAVLILAEYSHCSFNPWQPNISIHILHTVLYTFPMALTGRMKVKIKSFSCLWSFSQFSWAYCLIQQ